ncbi:hypothetical protein LBMAG53_14260 [Planctomycetota bacterium]|nr:hypothetical protein LBMAG53_14260 [Planctomycetota bacterium]
MDPDALLKGMKPVQDALVRQGTERSSTVFTGSAGGGAVKVRVAGDLSVKSVSIAPAAAAAAGGDVTLLEDLVVVAVGDALRQVRERYGATPEEQMQKLFSGADLGALMGPMLGGLGRR